MPEQKPPREGAYPRGEDHHNSTSRGKWNNKMIGVILGTNGTAIGAYLLGDRYPELRMIKKLEILLGWKAQDQMDLIPLVGRDLRYATMLQRELQLWKEQNPRKTPAAELRSLFPSRTEDPWKTKAKRDQTTSNDIKQEM